MLTRSVRNPLIIGVGTGAILVIGTAPALAGDTESPSPSASPSKSASATPTPTTPKAPTPPPDPTLSAVFSHVPGLVRPGSSYSVNVTVTPHIPDKGRTPTGVTLTLTASRAKAVADASKNRVYRIGSLKYARTVAVTVSVPGDVTSGKITVYAHVDGDNTPAAEARPLVVTVKKPATRKKKTSPSKGSGGGGSGTSNPIPSGGNLNPSTGSGARTTTTPSPQTAPSLPELTDQPTPSTAPVRNTSSTQSMRGTGDEADQLTFDRLASTQAAWLAALLVAFSLLLTQVRLGRASTKDPKAKGTHRKPRRAARRAH